LREEGRAFRATIYHALGDTYRRNGRWAEARACYLKVPEFLRGRAGYGAQFAVQSAHIFGALADLELRQGQLRGAAAYWRQALAAMQAPESWGYLELPAAGWVFIRLGEVLYEWNDLTAAHEHLAHGLKRADLGGDARTLIAGYLLATRLNLADGAIERANEFLERARPLVEHAPFPEWISHFERIQVELWLAQNRLRAAAVWADETLDDDALNERPENEETRLALARVLILRGDLPAREQGLEVLDTLLAEAALEGRTGVEIAALSLQALARWRDDDRARAMTDLERALRLAEPEGYIRLFVDLGLPMARLLQEARLRSVMPDYVGRLLAAFNDQLVPLASAAKPLPEPLTSREQDVLELIAAGLTNAEIGVRLFISEETVRKHAGNIYGKLDVHSRTEAVARARELELLN
jgi:LuxR family maltose regulon positive regulatory protein